MFWVLLFSQIIYKCERSTYLQKGCGNERLKSRWKELLRTMRFGNKVETPNQQISNSFSTTWMEWRKAWSQHLVNSFRLNETKKPKIFLVVGE